MVYEHGWLREFYTDPLNRLIKPQKLRIPIKRRIHTEAGSTPQTVVVVVPAAPPALVVAPPALVVAPEEPPLFCGCGLAWFYFALGFISIICWIIGSFYLCVPDKRERSGALANLIALIIASVLIVIFIVGV